MELALSRRHKVLDDTDKRIIEILQKNCSLSLEQVANDLKVPKATLHYRIRRLEEKGIIEGYHAKINPAKVGKDFVTITFVHTKYGPDYFKKLGNRLAQVKGVVAVYFIFGEIDFVVITRSDNTRDFLEKMEEIQKMDGIVSTSTQIVAGVFKEDGGIELESSLKKATDQNSRRSLKRPIA